MYKIERVDSSQSEGGRRNAPALPPLDWEAIERDRPDAHWHVSRDGIVSARCSLWWTHTPRLPGHTVGLIGHYAAAGPEVSFRLLERACTEMAGQGCTIAIGPMDGSTWRRYRALAERGDEPPFFLEPDNPDNWPGRFSAAGFVPIACYSSALCTNLSYVDPRLERVSARLDHGGIKIRPLDLSRIDEELSAIHRLSETAFRDQLLFSPITETEFMALYRPILSVVRPSLVLLAEQRGRLVGFLFAVPDVLQERRGAPVNTLIVKTAAVLPEREFAGLGNLLLARCHGAAAEMGYARAIYALMHESNKSVAVTSRYGKPFRRYELYQKALTR